MSTNTVAQSLALNVLLNMQARETMEAEPTVRMVSEPRLRVVRSSSGNSPSSNGSVQAVTPVYFTTQPGTVDATGFMKAWRRAALRDEQIAAIQSFIGYDMGKTFAVNEYAARTAAQKALKPVAVGTAPVKVQGINKVQGIPDFTQRRINDLLGREQLAAAKLVEHELSAANLTEGSVEQLTALGMVEIERERLHAIRHDLKTLTNR
jgi:hypothetical protein